MAGSGSVQWRGGVVSTTWYTQNFKFALDIYCFIECLPKSSFEGKYGVGLSAYSLVAMLRASLGKPADREEESKSFNKLKARLLSCRTCKLLPSPAVGGSLYQTPALVSLTQVHAVIDSKSYSSIAAKFKAQHHVAKLRCFDSVKEAPSQDAAGWGSL